MNDHRPGRHRYHLALVAALSATALASAAPVPAKLNGHGLLDLCTSNLMASQRICNAYIEGFVEGHFLATAGARATFCPPAGSGSDQVRKIVSKYLRKNAASLERGAGELVLQALAQAWPCGG